jgi:hypothetical protein
MGGKYCTVSDTNEHEGGDWGTIQYQAFVNKVYESSGFIHDGEFTGQPSDCHVSFSRKTMLRGLRYDLKMKGENRFTQPCRETHFLSTCFCLLRYHHAMGFNRRMSLIQMKGIYFMGKFPVTCKIIPSTAIIIIIIQFFIYLRAELNSGWPIIIIIV